MRVSCPVARTLILLALVGCVIYSATFLTVLDSMLGDGTGLSPFRRHAVHPSLPVHSDLPIGPPISESSHPTVTTLVPTGAPDLPLDVILRSALKTTPLDPNSRLSCAPKVANSEHVNVVLAYRNRPRHLESLMPQLLHHLRHQRHSVTLVNDTSDMSRSPLFNRGALLNVGFIVGEKESSWTVCHDVDLVPRETNCYLQPSKGTLVAMRRGKYWGYVGGVNAMLNEDWRKLDGYSNRFYGWGCEDDFVWVRYVNKAFYPLVYSGTSGEWDHIGTDHVKNVSEVAPQVIRAAMSSRFHEVFDGDGLRRMELWLRTHTDRWSVQQSAVFPTLRVVSVDLAGFDPCENGETLPELRPCRALSNAQQPPKVEERRS